MKNYFKLGVKMAHNSSESVGGGFTWMVIYIIFFMGSQAPLALSRLTFALLSVISQDRQ